MHISVRLITPITLGSASAWVYTFIYYTYHNITLSHVYLRKQLHVTSYVTSGVASHVTSPVKVHILFSLVSVFPEPLPQDVIHYIHISTCFSRR